ncbi:MAG: hypothetical protein SPL00_04835 [Bacilli bacterium]|nr:hypothetical protein [Bacilli bacterium]
MLRGFPGIYRVEINYSGAVNGIPAGFNKEESGPDEHGISTRIYTRNGNEMGPTFSLANGSTTDDLYVKSIKIYYNC